MNNKNKRGIILTRRCRAFTRNATLCKNSALPGEEYCHVHIREYKNKPKYQKGEGTSALGAILLITGVILLVTPIFFVGIILIVIGFVIRSGKK